MLINEVIGRHGTVRGFTDTTKVLRRGETQPVPILVDSLLAPDAGGLGELGRGQTVFAKVAIKLHIEG